jgi:hypothetical protein
VPRKLLFLGLVKFALAVGAAMTAQAIGQYGPAAMRRATGGPSSALHVEGACSASTSRCGFWVVARVLYFPTDFGQREIELNRALT